MHANRLQCRANRQSAQNIEKGTKPTTKTQTVFDDKQGKREKKTTTTIQTKLRTQRTIQRVDNC